MLRRYISVPKTKPGAAEANEAIYAAENNALVSFNYDGKLRVVEVHAVGQSMTGKLVMRGYQTEGLASRPLPQWTLFDFGKVESFEVRRKGKSLAPREGYAMADKQMALVFAEIAL